VTIIIIAYRPTAARGRPGIGLSRLGKRKPGENQLKQVLARTSF
jgi:hypothetical protein